MSDAYPYEGQLGRFIDQMLIPKKNYCSVCERDSCTAWCAKIKSLVRCNLFLDCPSCDDGRIGLNSWGNMECRACNAQFTNQFFHLSVDRKTYELRDVQRPWRTVRAALMPAKGIGRFPMDSYIDRLFEVFGGGR